MPDLRFSTLRPHDLLEIERQPSQQLVLGMPAEPSLEQAEALAAQPVAWTARDSRGRIRACFGICETFPRQHGQGWAVLAPRLGYAHLELTRFIQGQIAGCGLERLELLARGPAMAWAPDTMTAAEALMLAWQEPTPEMRWAVLLGLEPVHLLRRYGAGGENYVLYERIRFASAGMQREAA